jgi:RHS repeat-associated protein
MGGRSSRLRARLAGRWARARSVVGAVVVVASASAVVGLGSAQGGTGDPIQPAASSLAQLRVQAAGQPPSLEAMAGALSAARADADRVRAQEAARLEDVRSAAGVAERAQSRTAYVGLGRDDAVALLQHRFGSDVTAASQDVRTIGGWSPVRAIGDHVLEMVDGQGHRALLHATAPVQTGSGVVADLALGASANGWAPRAPLVDLRLPQTSADALAIGDRGVTVNLGGASVDGRVSADGRSVDYAGIAQDTDAVLTPTQRGAEVFWQLRSPQAPEDQRLHLDLPQGAQLVTDRAAGTITAQAQDGTQLLVVDAPTAVDAQGTKIAVTQVADGDDIDLHIAHQDADVAYPILIDPELTDPSYGSDWAGWVANTSNTAISPGPTTTCTGPMVTDCGSWGTGHYLFVQPGYRQSSRNFIQWTYTVPWAVGGQPSSTDAYISRAQSYDHHTRFHGDWSTSPVASNQIFNDTLVQPSATTTGTVDYDGPGAWLTASGSSQLITGSKNFLFVMEMDASGERQQGISFFGGGATVVITDPTPSSTTATGLSGWFGPNHPAVVQVHAHDPGLGVRDIAIYKDAAGDGRGVWSTDYGCDGTANNPCLQDRYETITLYGTEPNLTDGANWLVTCSDDIVRNVHNASSCPAGWGNFDRTLPATPALTLSAEADGSSHYENQPYILTARSSDATSGVKSMSMTVDGDTAHAVRWSDPSCNQPTACPGSKAHDFTFRAPVGAHSISVTATDLAGNVTAPATTTVTTTEPPPADNDRVGLEKFWDYDSTDTGAGSSVMVNSETGNVIWHDVPIVNPGRGLSTFVNLDYNSQERANPSGLQGTIDPLGGVALPSRPSYNAAGRGFSISVSGPTRVNEPLGGVGAADVRDGLLGMVSGLPTGFGNDIVLTDADGTRHHFTRDANHSAKWNAPPGVHLTLRRWATTGDPIIDRAWVMTRADGVAYFFDRLGYLIQTVDRNGNSLNYTYDKFDLLTGDSGAAAATGCTAATILGAVSGTPTAANGWGVQTLVSAAGTSTAGKLCALRLINVTDPGSRPLTLSYKSRASADQTTLTNALNATIGRPGNGSIDVKALLNQTSAAVTDLGALMTAPPLDTITDHAGRQYRFDYTNGDLTSFVEVANAASLAPAGDEARTWGFTYFPADDALSAHRLRDVTDVRDSGQERFTDLTYQTRTGTPPSGQPAALVPQTITDRNSHATSYAFSAYGTTTREVTVTDARSQVWTRDTDGYGRPTRITDPLGDATVLTWDDGTSRHNDLLKTAEGVTGSDPGSVTAMTYEPMSGLLATQTTYPDGESNTSTARTTELDYSLSNGASALRPASDPNTNFVADLTDVKQPRTLSGGAHVGWRYTVDTATGEVTARQDQDGGPAATTAYCVGSDGPTCPTGSVKSQTDEVGNTTTYGNYDANGLPQTVVDPKGNASGGTASAHRWIYRFDDVANLLSASDPRNPTAQTDPTAATVSPQFTTQFTYDAFDRSIKQVTPKDSNAGDYIAEYRTYDRNGNTLTDTNPGTGRSTTATFSKTDQPLTVTRVGWTRDSSSVKGNAYNTRNEVTTFTYDDTDLLVGRTDPLGGANPGATAPHTTGWTRDEAGRVIAETQYGNAGAQHIQSLALDPRGNVVGTRDAARNSSASSPTAAAQAAATAVSRSDYHALRTSTAYNYADEVTSTTEWPTAADTGSTERTDKYTYDADGNVVKHVLPRDGHDVPQGVTANQGTVATSYVYDHRDQLLTTTDPTGAVTALKRRADGKVVAQTTPRGVANGATDADGAYSYFTTRYAYDEAGDLLTRTVPYAPNQYARDGSANKDYKSWQVSYARNEVGDPTTITDGRGNPINNQFYDGGRLRFTNRPSWWQLSWSGDTTTGAPSAGKRYAEFAASDQLPTGGPQLTERTAPLSGLNDSINQPDETAEGKFGAVPAQDDPDWLPRGDGTTLTYDDDWQLRTVKDAANSVSRIDYDPAGRIVGTTQPLGDSASASRTDGGDPDPCSMATPSGTCRGVVAHRYDYDTDGNVSTARLLGNSDWESDFTYDSFDRIAHRVDPGTSTDPSATAASTRQTDYGFDINDNLTSRTPPRHDTGSSCAGYTGHNYNYEYDSLDRLTAELDPECDRWGYAYDVDDNLLRELTPNGSAATAADQPNYKTLRTYDADDRLVSQQGAVVDDGNGATTRNTTTFTYFPDGSLSSRTDPGAIAADGGSTVPRLTGYDYDGRGLLYRVTQGYAAGGGFSTAGDGPRTTLTEYDANSELRRVVNPSGVTTSGSGTSQSWAPTHPDAIGDNLTSTTSNDAVNATVYDYSNETTSGTPVNDAGYAGLPSRIYQPRADTGDNVLAEQFSYGTDGLDRLTTTWTVGDIVAHPQLDTSPHTSYTHLRGGWIDTSKDFVNATVNQNINTYAYDQAGDQVLWTLDADPTTPGTKSATTSRTYWPSGQAHARTGTGSTRIDAQLHYSYGYDPNGALAAVRDADHTHRTEYTRDGAERATDVVQRYETGDPTGTTWQRGRDSTFAYDPDGNVTVRRTNGVDDRSMTPHTMSDASTGAYTASARFTYDREDKETTGAFWEPTPAGNPTVTDSTCATGATAVTGVRCVRTTYHASGQRRTRRQQNDTLMTTYFDDYGQPTERRRHPTSAASGTAGDIVTSYTYDIRGNRTADKPGEATEYVYNARNQLTSWTRGSDYNTTATNGINHSGWTLVYDRNPDGSIADTKDHQGAATTPIAKTRTYNYTGQRLDSIKTQAGSSTTWDGYAANAFGSVISVTTGQTADPGPGGSRSDAGCSGTLASTDSHTTRYCYDQFDRLLQQRSPGGEQQEFRYDGMDRRDERIDHADGTAVASGFAYIGSTSSISGQKIPTGPTTAVTVSFDRDSADAPLAVTLRTGTGPATTKTYATDANGNPTGVEQTNGKVDAADRYVYDPYGDLDAEANSALSSDAATNPLRFNGFDYDSAVKTYDMRARDYRPDTGRFLQTDRYESPNSDVALIASPLTQNRYDFAANDPVDNVEFDGHAPNNTTDGPNDQYNGTGSTPTPSRKISHARNARGDGRSRAMKAQDSSLPDPHPGYYDPNPPKSTSKGDRGLPSRVAHEVSTDAHDVASSVSSTACGWTDALNPFGGGICLGNDPKYDAGHQAAPPLYAAPELGAASSTEALTEVSNVTSTNAFRLRQDIAVSPEAPDPLATTRSIGRASHNDALQNDLAQLPRGARDIRVNQQQVNAAGERVGINRPDLQYTYKGRRTYVEYEGPNNPRGAQHEARIRANDPQAGDVRVKFVK